MNLAVGFFDGVHTGHRRILADADAVLTFRDHPATVLTGEQPSLLMTTAERLGALSAHGRHVTALRFTPRLAGWAPAKFEHFLRRRFPELQTIFCGANWRYGAGGKGTPATLAAAGFDVRVVPYAKVGGRPVSSTRIRAALMRGKLTEANALLGYPYSAGGRVFRGKGVGHVLGCPTVNVRFGRPLPLRPGVYKILTSFGPALANYGRAPTFGEQAWGENVLEVHFPQPPPKGIRALQVSFLEFVRPERTFNTSAALMRQIARDWARAGFSMEGRGE